MSTRFIDITAPLALAACVLTSTAARVQAPAAAPPPPPSVKSGQAAPDFTANYLAMENGRPGFKSVKLSEFKGQKNVVLAFFPVEGTVKKLILCLIVLAVLFSVFQGFSGGHFRF